MEIECSVEDTTGTVAPVNLRSRNSTVPVTVYQISYVEGKPSYSIMPTTKRRDSPKKNTKPSSAYCCEHCGSLFGSELRLQEHRSTHDPLGNCGTQSKSPQQKNDSSVVNSPIAKQTKLPKKLTFLCPSCDFSTKDRSLMINHFTSVHSLKAPEVKVKTEIKEEASSQKQNQLTCADCGFSSENQVDIDFHTCQSKQPPTSFSCHVCTYECPTQAGLHNHLTKKHKLEKIVRNLQCDICEFKCSNRNTMYSHKRKHKIDDTDEGNETYFCNECTFKAKTKSSLLMHIQRRHKGKEAKQERPKLYSCEQCDYTNKNKYEIKVHVIRKHSDIYNFECEICGKKYKIKGDLTNHIRFQHREQPIMCDVCGKTCGNSNSLYVHQKFAHYKAEFECPICHRRMVSQANLDEHILKQHETRDDAVCEECGKKFTRSSRLKIHMRIHSGMKPFACKFCGKAFARKTALRQHLLIHSGQRPYICDICGKTFTQKPGLISHRKSHPGLHPPLPRVTIDHVLSDLLTPEES